MVCGSERGNTASDDDPEYVGILGLYMIQSLIGEYAEKRLKVNLTNFGGQVYCALSSPYHRRMSNFDRLKCHRVDNVCGIWYK
jgi:hypothetical protein